MRLPLRPQRRHPVLHRRLIQPILDGPQHAGDAPVDFGQRLGALAGAGQPTRALPGQFALQRRHERGDEIGRQQALLEAGQHPAPDLLAGDGAAVVAGALLAARGAAVAVLADDRVHKQSKRSQVIVRPSGV